MIASIPDEIWENKNKTILEPACGRGAFLIQCIKKRLSFELDIEIILNEIFGFDIDNKNIEECKSEIRRLAHRTIKQNKTLTIKQKQRKFARIICIVNNNIRVTKDSLKEDFNNVLYLHEQPKKESEKQYKYHLQLIEKNNLFNPAS